MRILFDNNIPDPLALFLGSHTVVRARDLEWDRFKDGLLLTRAEQDGFDLLITGDQRLSTQQNFKDRKIAVIVLRNIKWKVVERYIRRILLAVAAAQPASIQIVDIPFR